MSASLNDGGPALPCEQHETSDGTWNQSFQSGMYLRDWFAGQALAGIAYKGVSRWDFAAEDAYRAADAMLAERTKESSK